MLSICQDQQTLNVQNVIRMVSSIMGDVKANWMLFTDKFI